MKNKILLPVFFLLVVSLSIKGQTNVSGGIYSNTAWTLANSPYIVTDTVVVFPGVILTIEPGVTVKFDNDKRIEIRQAKLIALGTATDSITFTSNSGSPTQGIWGNVFLNDCPTPINFNYCNFKYANSGIYDYHSPAANDTLNVKNSNFTHNNFGMHINNNYFGIHKLDSCNFINNQNGVYAPYDPWLRAIVNDCNFSYNQNYGFNGVGGGSVGGSSLNNCYASYNLNYGISADTIINSTITHNNFGIKNGVIKNCIVSYNNYGIECSCCSVDSCIIRNNQYGIEGSVEIKNNIVDSNSVVGISIFGGCSANITNNMVRFNVTGIDVYAQDTITNNIIENNTIGIKLEANSLIYCNKICNSASYDLQYAISPNFSVTNNYWCTTDSALIESHIYDGYDNISLGLITFIPIDTTQCYLNGFCSAYFSLYPDSITLHQYWAVNLAAGVPPLTYLWSWGDGTTDTIANPSHIYSTAGYYNICLTISDSAGCTHSYCDSSYLSKNTNTMVYVNVVLPTGITESPKNESFLIYPNPAQENITITTSSQQKQTLVSIYNMQGQQMKSITFNNQNSMQLDVRALARGMYIVKLKSDNGVGVRKFVKN